MARCRCVDVQSAPVTRKIGAMGRQAVGFVLAASTLTLGGCATITPAAAGPSAPLAQATDQVGDPGGLSPGSGAGPAQITDGAELAFPLTVRRVGGAGDFNDTVVVQTDGVLQVDTQSIHGRHCQLPAPQRSEMFAALRTAPLSPGPGTPEPATSDGAAGVDPPAEGAEPAQIRITVTDVHGRLADLTDPSLGKIASSVEALVQDVTLTSPITTPCSTATSTQP